MHDALGMGFIVDQHYLTPLFNPGSIVVFAGDPDAEPAHAAGRARCAVPCARAATPAA